MLYFIKNTFLMILGVALICIGLFVESSGTVCFGAIITFMGLMIHENHT